MVTIKEGTSLLAPNSHAARISSQLLSSILVAERGRTPEDYYYLGCCLEMHADNLKRMKRSNEWDNPGEADTPDRDEMLNEMRGRCLCFNIWEKVLGYEEGGLLLDNDWGVSFGKGVLLEHQCYWIKHSHIEYIWLGPGLEKINLNYLGTVTGRMSSKGPGLYNRPKCKHGNSGHCGSCREEAFLKTSFPYAIPIDDISQWGCPECGYAKGHIGVNKKTGMPAISEGTYVWYCNSCEKFCYGLSPGVERSTIPFGGVGEGTSPMFIARREHPRKGTPSHTNKVEKDEVSPSEDNDSSE